MASSSASPETGGRLPEPPGYPAAFAWYRRMASALAAATAASVGFALLLGWVVGPRASAAALVAAGLALLGLAVTVNALLRLQGLGGEGLGSAAGVLGPALALFPHALRALGAGSTGESAGESAGVSFDQLGFAGLLFCALWAARAGRFLRRLLEGAVTLGWASLLTAAATVVLAVQGILAARAGGTPHGTLATVMPFVPLGLWSAVLARLYARGVPRAALPAPE